MGTDFAVSIHNSLINHLFPKSAHSKISNEIDLRHKTFWRIQNGSFMTSYDVISPPKIIQII